MIVDTPRLRLREFVETDWSAVLAYQSDPRYLTYYPWTERREAEVRAFVDRFMAWQAAQPRLKFQLAVTLRDGGVLIGNCGIRLTEAGLRPAELGYELAPQYWGRDSPQRLRERWPALALRLWDCTASGRSACPKTQHRDGSWRCWECNARPGCGRHSGSRGAVGHAGLCYPGG